MPPAPLVLDLGLHSSELFLRGRANGAGLLAISAVVVVAATVRVPAPSRLLRRLVPAGQRLPVPHGAPRAFPHAPAGRHSVDAAEPLRGAAAVVVAVAAVAVARVRQRRGRGRKAPRRRRRPPAPVAVGRRLARALLLLGASPAGEDAEAAAAGRLDLDVGRAVVLADPDRAGAAAAGLRAARGEGVRLPRRLEAPVPFAIRVGAPASEPLGRDPEQLVLEHLDDPPPEDASKVLLFVSVLGRERYQLTPQRRTAIVAAWLLRAPQQRCDVHVGPRVGRFLLRRAPRPQL
mmetsp:Transcript_6531/g.15830  ORF Transcript_6531/g.15830 Transcript_6531/m.15830 type:complete len:290 (+) Transcript_6531:2899-3768(+)